MKRYGDLFEKFCSFENLYIASQKSQRGKRYKNSTASFNFDLEGNIINIQQRLKQGNYQFGKYVSFYVHDPKTRLISAAPYQDRVIHHAICNIIEPIFEPVFVYDLYSNRKEKGTHKAVDRYQKFCRINEYVLKCDIKKYFASIDKGILFKIIYRKIKDNMFLDIIRDVIYSYDRGGKASGNGIPLGNLTSQIFANIYLNDFDHYIKENLRCRYYIRYVDDFVVFDNSKRRLNHVKDKIQEFLKAYNLELHREKSHIRRTDEGIKFLGYRIFSEYRLVNKENVKRFKRKIRKLQEMYEKGNIQIQKITESIRSWVAHTSHADSYKLRKKIFDNYVFNKG